MAKWIKANSRTKEVFLCSACYGAVYQHYKVTKNGECTYRYCPWCGEKMDKEETKE